MSPPFKLNNSYHYNISLQLCRQAIFIKFYEKLTVYLSENGVYIKQNNKTCV